MLMSPLTPSTFTSFVNEIKLNLDIIEKLKQLQGVQLVLQNQQSFQMVYDFLLYANVKVRHYLKEKHQNGKLIICFMHSVQFKLVSCVLFSSISYIPFSLSYICS